jgi:hypothetical protein
MKRNTFAATFLAVLLVSFVTPMFVLPSLATGSDGSNSNSLTVVRGTWYRLNTEYITVLFPADGEKPMFLWWYNANPNRIYVVKYQGLIEYFTLENPLLGANDTAGYYNHLREASIDNFNAILNYEEEGLTADSRVQELLTALMSLIDTNWHSPFLDFEAARWTLTDVANITAPSGNIIGVTFAFNLTETPLQPRFEFADNNIMIRVRIYNQTVQEEDQTGATYTVYPGEMKMDLVINKWVWNLDSITQVLTQLHNDGYNVNIPHGKSGLALWVNLASINITDLPIAQSQPDQIEGQSTATNVNICNSTNVNITSNQTATGMEDPIEYPKPIVKINFATQNTTLAGFFEFVSNATVDYHNGTTTIVPVKASYIAAGNNMRLFIGYPYFGNGTLTHDPSIGVDVPNIDTTPKYTVQIPTGMNVTPVVLGNYVLPLSSIELMAVLIVAVSATASILYAVERKRKTPVNIVGVGTTG